MKRPICSKCGSEMKYYDRVKRIVRREHGTKNIVYIERYFCKSCCIVRRILPNYILPHKHYDKRIIDGFINGVYSNEQLEFEDYPCELTIANWKRYFEPPTFI